MEYAHRHPEEFAARIAGLVFVATTAEGTTHTRYGLHAAARPAHARRRDGRRRRAGPLRCLAPAPRGAAGAAPGTALAALRRRVRAVRHAAHHVERGPGVAALDRRVPGVDRAQQRLETLAALGDVPAAVLVGDRDRLTPPRCAESIAEALPGTELTVCPGAGHMLMLERPDRGHRRAGRGGGPGRVTAPRAAFGAPRPGPRPPAGPAGPGPQRVPPGRLTPCRAARQCRVTVTPSSSRTKSGPNAVAGVCAPGFTPAPPGC